MITVKRVKDVLENWDLREETVKNVVHPAGFISENTFCVGESYLIKAYTVPGKAKNNAEILSALKEAGLSKAAAVPTKSGESFAADGEFCFLLMERIPGETMEVSEMFSPDASAKARYLGEIIGQLHLVLKANDEIVCNERNIFEEVRDQWLEPAKAAMELPDGFCEEYAEAFGALHDKLPVQMIHRDPNLSNIILKDGKIAGFIDFELSQRSIRLFDPCYAATGILAESGAAEQNDGEKLRQWLSIYKDIIRGYDSVVHLTREEKQALPYVVFSIQLICVGYFSGEEKFRELADTNIAMLRWLLNNREQLEI